MEYHGMLERGMKVSWTGMRACWNRELGHVGTKNEGMLERGRGACRNEE